MEYADPFTAPENGDFPALGKDLSQWRHLARFMNRMRRLPKSLHDTEQWDVMAEKEKLSVLSRVAQLQQLVFRSRVFPIEFYTPEEQLYAPGFQGILAYGQSESLAIYDGDMAIPRAGYATQIQTMFYGLARQFLYTQTVGFLKDTKKNKDTPVPVQIADIIKYHAMNLDVDGTENQWFDVMTGQPMPDQFDEFLAIPSYHYALEAVRVMNRDLFGTDDIDPELMRLIKQSFIHDQAAYLMAALEEDNTITNPNELYHSKWRERAECYIEQSFKEPAFYNIKAVAHLTGALKKNFQDYTAPLKVVDALAGTPDLEIMSLNGHEEAVRFWLTDIMADDKETGLIRTLKPESRLTLLGKLGPQRELSDEDREDCDSVARDLLQAWPLKESFLSYYEALFQQMAIELRQNGRLNELGEKWDPTERPRINGNNFLFLMTLNEAVSEYLGHEARPLHTFRKARKVNPKPWDKDAAAFASFGEDPNGHLRMRYNLRSAPEEGPFMAINTHPDIGLFKQATPMRASQIIVHEIFHHHADDLKHDLRSKVIKPDDPRYEQIHEFITVDQYSHVDNLLRADFSLSVYPLIQTEKFQYWVMDAFKRSRPFDFLKS